MSKAPATVLEMKSRRVSCGARIPLGIFIQYVPSKLSEFPRFSIRNQIRRKLLWLLRGRRHWRRRIEAPVNRKFLFCFFPVTGSLQGRSKRVMDGGISRRQTLRHAQRRNCVFVSLDGDKTNPPAQVGFREIGIELCGLGESGDSLIPFLVSSGKFSQDVLGASIVWINLDFL